MMRQSSGALLGLGAVCMLIALGGQNITLASGDYRAVLVVALSCMVVADLCFAVVFKRGGLVRWVAVLMASPSLLIAWDFLRRAPHAFAK